MFIGIDVSGVEEVNRRLSKLPIEAQDAAVDAANQYLLDVVRHYPPKKSVTRREAYGVTFFTDKQRKWFFAALDDGSLKIPYPRTQGLAKGWKIIGKGRNSILVNEAGHANLVMGEGQSRHAAAIGWQKLTDIAKERIDKIMQVAEGAIKRTITKLGL